MRVNKILKRGSVIVAFLAISDILLWLYADTLIVSPFVCILALISCPFFFWMGCVKPSIQIPTMSRR